MPRDNPLDNIDWDQVDSSNIQALSFDEPTQTVCVRFKGGGIYTYIGVSHEIYVNLRHAPSVGVYLNNVVKGFPYTRWSDEAQLLAHLNLSATCYKCGSEIR